MDEHQAGEPLQLDVTSFVTSVTNGVEAMPASEPATAEHQLPTQVGSAAQDKDPTENEEAQSHVEEQSEDDEDDKDEEEDEEQSKEVETQSEEVDDGYGPLRYLAVHDDLPIDRPIGYPHVIGNKVIYEDSEEIDNLRAADGAVTLLYRYDPQALDAFLDLSKKAFVFWRKEPRGSATHHVLIMRRGKTVTVSSNKLILAVHCRG